MIAPIFLAMKCSRKTYHAPGRFLFLLRLDRLGSPCAQSRRGKAAQRSASRHPQLSSVLPAQTVKRKSPKLLRKVGTFFYMCFRYIMTRFITYFVLIIIPFNFLGDFVSRVGGISVMPGCYADIIHVLKTAPRPIIVHFIKSSFLPHIDVDLTPTWKTATPREPTTHLVTLTLPTQLSGPYAFHITLPPPAQKIAADHSDVPTIGITADEVEAFDRLFIDAGAHRDRLPTEVNAAEMQVNIWGGTNISKVL